MRLQACLLSLVVIAFHPSLADAELVYFSTGRSLSVKGHRTDGESVVLMLRGGGEMVCAASLVARIEPDEVPFPEASAPAGRDDPGGSPDLSTQVSVKEWELRVDPRYDPVIGRIATQYGVDPALVRAVIQVESAYERRARSPKGALGLMQLMPAVARQYALADPYDAESNIEAGTRHLKSLLGRLPLELALAAYNAGEAAVLRFGSVPPYPETRQYVARILRLLGR